MPEKKRGRPATGKSPHVAGRVPEEVKRKAEEKAKREGRTVSDVVREAMEKYVENE